MKTRRQQQSKRHYTILPSHGIHQQSFIIHPRTSKRQSKSITQVFSSKAHMPIYCFSSQIQPCLQWEPLEYIGSSEENLMVQLAILLAWSKYLNLSLRLCKAQGTKYLIKYLKNAKKRNLIDFSSFSKCKNS